MSLRAPYSGARGCVWFDLHIPYCNLSRKVCICRTCHRVWWWGVLLVGFVSCEMMLSHLKAILMPVCLKMLVIFLICGDGKVKVAHFVCLLRCVVMKGFVWEMFRCILSLSRVNMFMGLLLLCVVCKICFHSMRFLRLAGGWTFSWWESYRLPFCVCLPTLFYS